MSSAGPMPAGLSLSDRLPDHPRSVRPSPMLSGRAIAVTAKPALELARIQISRGFM
jgi:hypothetical protein